MLLPVTNKDIEIFFEPITHKYIDQFDNEYISVTTLLGKHEPEFKKEYWANRKAQETGKLVSQVINEWDDINKKSIDKGNSTHSHLETCIKNVSIFNKNIETINKDHGNRIFSINDICKDDNGSNIELKLLEQNFPNEYSVILDTIKYYTNKGYKIYTEINVFHPYYLISGTVDVLLVKGEDFVIIDWKTNRKPIYFSSGYFKKIDGETTNIWVSTPKNVLLYPLHNLDNCNGVKYSLQLNEYAMLLEAFGFKCKGLILFHIRDSFVSNKYGHPVINNDGSYTIDTTKPKKVNHYIINNYYNYVFTMIDNYRKDLKLSSQLKLM